MSLDSRIREAESLSAQTLDFRDRALDRDGLILAAAAPPRANVNRDSCLGQIKLQGSTAHEHIDELSHA